MPVKMLQTVVCVVLTAVLLSGCPSWWNTSADDSENSPEKLFSEAEKNFEQKSYDKAVEKYERLKSAFPDFKDMAQVYLKIGDAYFEEKSYDKAVARYQQFLQLYPRNPEVSKVKFNIAMSYFSQEKGTDLDNRVVKRAADAFKLLAQDQDAGEWAKKAEGKYQECLKKLAEKELDKARTYISASNYKAARMAAQRVLDEYGKSGYDKEAEELLTKIKKKE